MKIKKVLPKKYLNPITKLSKKVTAQAFLAAQIENNVAKSENKGKQIYLIILKRRE
jgi:hypothetical protein